MERSKKNSLFHVLLHKTGIRAHKDALLEPFNVESVTDLKEDDLDALIDRLTDFPRNKATEVPKKIRVLRSKVLLAAEAYMNIKIASPETWERFNGLMLDKRIAGKMMWEMTEQELKTVNSKLQKMIRAIDVKRQKETFIATNN